ncbi:hypothetical protein AAZX31_06G193000, partial [Glycine max]
AEVCDICGAHGFDETIVTCSKCNINSEHSYCMQFNTLIVPIDWICEPCKSKDVSTSPRKVYQDIGLRASKMRWPVETGRVKFLTENEVMRLSSANFPLPTTRKTVGSKNVSKIPSLTPKSYPSISHLLKYVFVISFYETMDVVGPPKEFIRENQLPLGGATPGKKVQTHDAQKENPTKGAPFEALSAGKSSPIVGGIPRAAAECNKSNIEKSGLQSVQENLNLHCKFLPSSFPAWRGQFQILQTAASSEFYDGLEAQPPCIVNKKAYKFSTEMPPVLQLESLPVLNALTDIFQDNSPRLQDIALYFFPSELTERSRKNLDSILKFMNAEKSMLRSYINGVELLVFTSNQLDMDSKAAVKTRHFLWGLFRQKKIDKAVERVPDLELVDMDIDMIGGKNMVGRADDVQNYKPKSDIPLGF